MTIYTSYTWG